MNHSYYLKVAEQIAQWSPDVKKVGCVIVSNGKIVSMTYNKLPENTGNLYYYDLKPMRKIIIHAEIGALLKLNKKDVNDTTILYTSMSCCGECIRMINYFGIKHIVFSSFHKSYKETKLIADLLNIRFESFPLNNFNQIGNSKK